MHPDHTNAAVEDLWPGDVILVRRPNGWRDLPHKVVDVRDHLSGGVAVRLQPLDSDWDYDMVVEEGWSTRVQRV